MSADPIKPREVYCSFCGISQKEVETMIAGPVLVAICNRCVWQCVEIVADKRSEKMFSGAKNG